MNYSIQNDNIQYIYNNVINITKLNLNEFKTNNLISIIKNILSNKKNFKNSINELNDVIKEIINLLKKKSNNNNNTNKNLNVDMLDYAKSQYVNIPTINPYSQWDNRPLNTKDTSIPVKDVSQYKKERDSLLFNNKPDDIDFRDKNFVSKKSDKDIQSNNNNNNNNNNKSELDKFFENNNNNNNELDNYYKDYSNEIKIDDNKKYDNDDDITNKFEKLQKERKLSFENKNNIIEQNINTNTNTNTNTNINNNQNENQYVNKNDITEIYELLSLCVSKIE
jgi:hypothetical protein